LERVGASRSMLGHATRTNLLCLLTNQKGADSYMLLSDWSRDADAIANR